MIKAHHHDHQTIWYDSRIITKPTPLLFDPSYWQSQGKVLGSAQGRGTTWFVDMGNVEAALRHYRRGGLFGKVVDDKYWFTGWEKSRSYQELIVLERLQHAGVHVPKPIAARVVKTGLTYTADILVEKISGARDLVAILSEKSLRAQHYQRIGEMIAHMHQQQVNHTDLNIHNILLDEAERVWIIDFDKCRVEEGNQWKSANLARLKRSFEKEVERFGITWGESDWRVLLTGYHSL